MFQNLRNLVDGENVRIDDFGITLQDVIADLKQRKRDTIRTELQLIAQYFSNKARPDEEDGEIEFVDQPQVDASQDLLNRLNTAFALLRYRDVMEDFITAIREIKMFGDDLSLQVIRDINDNEWFIALQSNFLLTQSTAIFRGMDNLLSSLDSGEVAFIAKLTTSKPLVQFLKRFGKTFAEGSLERAKNRAITNEHALQILMKVEPLRDLLQPLYDQDLRSLDDLKTHFRRSGRFESTVRNPDPPALMDLVTVSENWSLVEVFFQDSSDAQHGAEAVERLVQRYHDTGAAIFFLAFFWAML